MSEEDRSWVKPGNKAYVLENPRIGHETATEVEILRVGKRDVVVKEASIRSRTQEFSVEHRFNFNSLRQTGEREPWSSSRHLAAPGDPRVIRALELSSVVRTASQVEKLMTSWRRDPTNHDFARRAHKILTEYGFGELEQS